MKPILYGAALAAALAAPAFSQDVSVSSYAGEVAAPANPEKVVVFDIAAADTLTALGANIDGLPDPYYVDYLADVAANAETVGTLFEPDFEKLATMAPGLIVAGGRSSAQVEALSAIAPTIDMTIWGENMIDQTRDRIDAYGAIFGLEDKAAELDAALDAKIEEARAAVSGKGNGMIVLTNGGKISAYGDDSRFGWIHQATGLPEAFPDLTAETHGEAISFEFIAEVNPDWLLVIDRGAAIGQAGEAAAATLDNPLVAGTTAGQQGQIVYLSPGPIYIAGGGVTSMTTTLDEIIAAFNG
ncbi:siderophore ABC transporter substrate-binding protein [Pseudoruegeria sp. HB172150]|uniref:siderophore ABC transporter substrate-binding protein n=1 Tax=Pseudoruegeria sp. HB172150 TaxID=2721164 RepID=UPI0015566EE8|nr:siderophore ABC transporter substrate-binding protein [Pseudoruegeria sp. HB172150]